MTGEGRWKGRQGDSIEGRLHYLRDNRHCTTISEGGRALEGVTVAKAAWLPCSLHRGRPQKIVSACRMVLVLSAEAGTLIG